LCLKGEAEANGTQVLPSETGRNGLAGGAVPNDRRRPLCAYPHRFDVFVTFHGRIRDLENRLCDRGCVKLDEPLHRRARQDVALMNVHDRRIRPHDRRADAARADIDGQNAHFVSPLGTHRQPLVKATAPQ
jgi:hypothetical protein